VIDETALIADLERIGLDGWAEDLLPLARERLSDRGHGDFAAWRETLDAIREAKDDGERESLLKSLAPWRKGPFDIGGITIDAEWRSDLKWQRLADALSPLDGRTVLDVGCGNGWYALRMLDAGASLVIGIDPTLLFVVQFAAVVSLTGRQGAYVLPFRLEEVPRGSQAFDTTFSMGVLYHRRTPGAHLDELLDTLRPGGELVLETLVLPGDHHEVLEPDGRYARMRNVWHLPTVPVLLEWLDEAGFRQPRVVDVSRTTTAEQRPTDWMRFESLEHALDPGDPTRTIEGLPAPTRAVLLASAP
jgi:tRNA (mo5U34)-methyltransferase